METVDDEIQELAFKFAGLGTASPATAVRMITAPIPTRGSAEEQVDGGRFPAKNAGDQCV